MSSPKLSRPLSVNHISFDPGCQSNPTELRTPVAYASIPDPSARIRKMLATRLSVDSQTLHGAPTPTYNHPSGPKPVNLHSCCLVKGRSVLTTTGAAGF